MILVLLILNFILIKSDIDEISKSTSNNFLSSTKSFRTKYEESIETIEAKRESCLDEYRTYRRRRVLSPFCTKYCADTTDCEGDKETSACNHQLASSKFLKFAQKIERTCYIRITAVVQYEQAKNLCVQHGLQLAIIDNVRLLERLKDLNMFHTTCKGQCPTSLGYYIGLKRASDNTTHSKWIWSNNVTWIQNELECDDYHRTLYNNSNVLCYMGNDGEMKVTVWNQGEPNDDRSHYFQDGEQCVEIMSSTDNGVSKEKLGRLNDVPCSKPVLGVLCQVQDIKPSNKTRFEYFARIVGFNNDEFNDSDLIPNFHGPILLDIGFMSEIVNSLEKLLSLPSFTTERATYILNAVDQLVNATGEIEIEISILKPLTNRLLRFLDRFSNKIHAENQQNVSLSFESMNMSIIDIGNDRNRSEWFAINFDKDQDKPNIIIELNTRVLQSQFIETDHYRVVETIFSNFNLFPQTHITSLGSPFSYQITNMTMIKTEEELIRYQIRIFNSSKSQRMSCVYWSFNENNGSWISNDGCRFAGYIDDYAQCYCNHMTHFALLLLPEPDQSQRQMSNFNEFLLTFVTFFGIILSIFGLSIILITFVIFRRSRKNYLHAALIMLCMSILFVDCFYVPFNFVQPDLYSMKNNLFCMIFGFLLHYFFFASFIWMFIMTLVQYMYFVRIFNTHISHFFIKTCIIGWLIPFIFPTCVILFGSNGGYNGQNRCWIYNRNLLYLTFLIPIAIVIFTNILLYGLILKSIFQKNTTVVTPKSHRTKLQVGAAVCCFVSIGFTWLYGIIVLIQPSFIHQFIFSISNSLQGFLLFLFHVYLSKPKRELWRTLLMQRGFYRSFHSSSTNTHSTGLNNSFNGNINNSIGPIKYRFRSTKQPNHSTRNSHSYKTNFKINN